jgi:hypothetical protein
MFTSKRLASLAGFLALAAVGVAAMPGKAEAWWRGGWCCGIGIGIALPPVVVAPPPVYYAPPPPAYYPPPVAAYYPPPRPVWVPPHWQGGYWVPGHWA